MTSTDRAGRRRGWVEVVVIAALTVLALVLRAPALDPSSLWLDDAWVAFAHRAETFTELRYVGFSSPGFVLLLHAWLSAVGFSELNAQLLPLAAGVAAPGFAFWLARRSGLRLLPSLLAALVLATSPIAVDYATRVKAYTLESVLALLLLGVAGHVLRDLGSARRFAVLLATAVLATVVSAFLAPYVAAALAAVVIEAARRRERRSLRWGLAAGAAYAVFAAAWYLGMLAPAVTTSISGFWSGHYLVVDDGVPALLSSLWAGLTGVTAGMTGGPAWVASVLVVALAGSAVVVARRRPSHAALLVIPLLVAGVLAGLQLAPLGGGRTDLYLYPSLALLLGHGADRLASGADRLASGAEWRPGRSEGTTAAAHRTAGALLVLAGVGLVAVAEPATAYPRYDVRPLTAELERRAEPDDAVLVYPATMWAHALYTDGTVHLEPEPTSSWGFAPRFADPDTHVLPPGRDDPDVYAPTVQRVAHEADRVWLLASHWRDDYAALQLQLEHAGFERIGRDRREGAELSLWRTAR